MQSDFSSCSDIGLTLKTSAFKLFTVVNLRFNSVVNTKLPVNFHANNLVILH